MLVDKGFICTDLDTWQWVKKVSDTIFLVYEQSVLHVINLEEYTRAEIEDAICGYYKSLEELEEIYGEDSNQIIAEILAEQAFQE